NTHDMNSVMEIGEKILFLKDGLKAWEGTNEEIFRTDNKTVTDFVYSSDLFKKVRERSEEHTSELQSRENIVCRLLLEKKNNINSIVFPLIISIRPKLTPHKI